MSNDFMHVTCCAYIINLIVYAGLKDINDVIIKKKMYVKCCHTQNKKAF